MNTNGKVDVLGLLRADLIQTRQALSAAVANHQNSAAQAAQLNATLATVLFKSGEAMVEITDDETQTAYDATWHRVKLEVLEHEGDVKNSLRVSLVPVTLGERAADQRAKKKAEKKAAKKGPKLLGADGMELEG